MYSWISVNIKKPKDGEEVLAVVSGQHGGFRYDHEVVNAIYDHGSWYLDDGVVDGDEEKTLIIREWMPIPTPVIQEPCELIDGRELINRLVLISATAGQWSGSRVIGEVIKEVRSMIK